MTTESNMDIDILVRDADRSKLEKLIIGHCKSDSVFRDEVLAVTGDSIAAEVRALKAGCERTLESVDSGYGQVAWGQGKVAGQALENLTVRAVMMLEEGNTEAALELAWYVLDRVSDFFNCGDDGWYTATDHAERILETGAVLLRDDRSRFAWADRLKDLANKNFYRYMEEGIDPGAVAQIFEKDPADLGMPEQAAELVGEDGEYFYGDEDLKRELRNIVVAQLAGPEAAVGYMRDHMDVDVYRLEFIREAREAGDFARAECLCTERMRTRSERWCPRDTRFWEGLLFEIYQEAGKRAEQTELAEKILLDGDTSFYETTKKLLQQAGRWEAEYPQVLQRLKTTAAPVPYMRILEEEGEKSLLMEEVRKNPHKVLDFGAALCPEYLVQVTDIACRELRKQASGLYSRDEYRDLAGELETLAQIGAKDAALSLIDEFLKEYSKKWALKRELNRGREKILAMQTVPEKGGIPT